MSQKTIGLILIIVGVLGIIAVVVGGLIGWPSPGFGPKKIIAIIVGALIALVGIGLRLWKVKVS